jgi:hypothetical protein
MVNGFTGDIAITPHLMQQLIQSIGTLNYLIK